MCDFLNDYYDEPFSVKSCSPNGEYYKYSKPQKPQFQGPRNLMVSGGKKTNELDRYNIIHSIQPQPIVISDKIQIDRHDVLVALLDVLVAATLCASPTMHTVVKLVEKLVLK